MKCRDMEGKNRGKFSDKITTTRGAGLGRKLTVRG